MGSDTQEALRRLGMPLVACDECGKLSHRDSCFSVLALLDGEIVDDWSLIACSRKHATDLLHLPDRSWRTTEQWYIDAVESNADVSYSIVPVVLGARR